MLADISGFYLSPEDQETIEQLQREIIPRAGLDLKVRPRPNRSNAVRLALAIARHHLQSVTPQQLLDLRYQTTVDGMASVMTRGKRDQVPQK